MAWANRRLGRSDRTKPAAIDEETAAQFRQWGVKVESEVTADEELLPIIASNWPSFMAFLACETQWRVVATLAGLIWIGLDYAACDVVLRRRELPDQVFDDLRAIEDAALEVLNGSDG
ncbi:DUF1799 domain-containing protein